MSFILDCETQQHAIRSLAIGFSCTEQRLVDTLLSIDLENLYRNHGRELELPCDQYLYKYVVEQIGPHKDLDAVNWFHCTRTTISNNFSDGVKPLNNILNTIWFMLLNHAPDELTKNRLNSMKQNGVHNFQYSLKTEDEIHWGPYAILVKEVAFNTQRLAQHDYLGMPEIIEDICNSFKNKFNINIYSFYSSILTPKIVKFTSKYRVDSGCIETALCYAHSSVWKTPIGGSSVNCFDSDGQTISPEQIISVETISP